MVVWFDCSGRPRLSYGRGRMDKGPGMQTLFTSCEPS